MIVDHANKFVFVAVAKNASTALHNGFERSLGRSIPHGPERTFHASAVEISEEIGACWMEYFKIGFVRDPYERFLSAYWDFYSGRPASRKIELPFEEFCHSFIGSRWENLRHF